MPCTFVLSYLVSYQNHLYFPKNTVDEQGIGFHDVATIAGYVPQVQSDLFSFPLIVCSTQPLGSHLFDW